MLGTHLIARILAVTLITLSSASQLAFAQATSAAEYLARGVTLVEAGDFLVGLMTLNEAVAPSSNADSATLARAHVYRAQAYLGLNQPERARAAALLALEANPSIAVSAPEFSPSVVKLFDDLRLPAAVDAETAGLAAEKSGRHQDAFLAYLTAFQAMPDPAPAADERRLRQRIVEVVARLETKPVIPQEASAHYAKATQLLEAEALLGASGTASSEAAAAELQRAIRLAPWWPEATFKLAGVQQKLQRVDEAVANLNLYRLADPAGYAAAIAAKTSVPAERTPVRREPVVVARPMATIYVYWPPQARGAGGNVRCNGALVAELKERRFVAIEAPPGVHRVAINSATVSVSAEGGRAYYLRGSTEGFPAMRRIREVAADEATAEIRDKQVTANDSERTFRTDCGPLPPAGRQRR